jgi:hypothetical protein
MFENHTGYTTRGETTYSTTETTHIYVIQAPTSAILAKVWITPKSLNLRARGRWITAYIELPKGYSAKDINVSSILLNDTIRAEPKRATIGDYDHDSRSDLMVKFNRAEVISYILNHIPRRRLVKERFMTVTLTLSGRLNDGTQFNCSTSIRIISLLHRDSTLHHHLPFF